MSNSAFSRLIEACKYATWAGTPNVLSARQVHWPRIDDITKATRKEAATLESSPLNVATAQTAAFPAMAQVPVRHVIHQRRSAQSFDPDHEPWMTADQFYSFIFSVKSQFPSLPWKPCVHLAIMVHRVHGIEPGLYILCRNQEHLTKLRSEVDKEYQWVKPTSCPAELEFHRLVVADAQKLAATISCHQEIASDGSFALGMIAHFEDEIMNRGPWFYKRLFWETGMIGQRLYLQAEACGFRGTGIGCYFDDLFHAVLGLETFKFQSLYHFTVGYPEVDDRLATLPPYQHLQQRQQ